MLLAVLEVMCLLGAIILPLVPRSSKVKKVRKYKIDRDTHGANYAINQNGALEEIPKPSVSNH